MNGEETLVVVPEATDLREIFNKFHDMLDIRELMLRLKVFSRDTSGVECITKLANMQV